MVARVLGTSGARPFELIRAPAPAGAMCFIAASRRNIVGVSWNVVAIRRDHARVE